MTYYAHVVDVPARAASPHQPPRVEEFTLRRPVVPASGVVM
jgi:hypothetical protein